MIAAKVGGFVEEKNGESFDSVPEVAASATAVARGLSRMSSSGDSTEKGASRSGQSVGGTAKAAVGAKANAAKTKDPIFIATPETTGFA
jgi:hypothetical protein